ncbi:MAG TPA: hypothetical protein DEF51_39310 [Myxococcales bacterium]|nr:hypothetical protein [Myxococcales bacterium]
MARVPTEAKWPLGVVVSASRAWPEGTDELLEEILTEHEVSAAELAFPDGSPFRRHVAAYRMWVGPAHCRLPPGQPAAPTRRPPRISTLLCPQS